MRHVRCGQEAEAVTSDFKDVAVVERMRGRSAKSVTITIAPTRLQAASPRGRNSKPIVQRPAFIRFEMAKSKPADLRRIYD